MDAATGDSRASGGCDGLGADGADVHDLAASDGDVYWELPEPLGHRGQRVIAEHDDVGQLPGLDAAERLLLEACVRGVDSLAPQGLLHGEPLARVHLLAAERLVRRRRAEIPQRVYRIVPRCVGP